jgi:hypothetical protein
MTMKQHISKLQFNKLSKKGKENYLAWIIKKSWKGGEVIAINHTVTVGEINHQGTDESYSNTGVPLITIGHMIELLDKTCPLQISNLPRYKKPRWYVGVSGCESEELCDALWEAVVKSPNY